MTYGFIIISILLMIFMIYGNECPEICFIIYLGSIILYSIYLTNKIGCETDKNKIEKDSI
jgi:hypothetical protein